MKNITLLILLLLSLSTLKIYSQKHYYISDTTYTTGDYKIINQRGNKNYKYCAIIENGHISYYPADSIAEYAVGNGTLYFSKKIQHSNSERVVFLKLIEKEKVSFFHYMDELNKSTYYIETKDGTFHTLSDIKKDNRSLFRSQLREITSDCQEIEESIHHVSYNERSLRKLLEHYNQCKYTPFPFFKFGILAGYEMVQLNPGIPKPTDPVELSFNYNGGFSFGFFIDYPIRLSNFSVHSEINFSQHTYSLSKRIGLNEYDYMGTISSLKLPILIKYAYPSNQIRPYITGGGVIARHVRNNLSLFETAIQGYVIEINKLEKALFMSDVQMGYAAGIGIDYKLNYKKYLFLEMRYGNLFGLKRGSMDTSEIQFITGINF